jgi:hypothetical protein
MVAHRAVELDDPLHPRPLGRFQRRPFTRLDLVVHGRDQEHRFDPGEGRVEAIRRVEVSDCHLGANIREVGGAGLGAHQRAHLGPAGRGLPQHPGAEHPRCTNDENHPSGQGAAYSLESPARAPPVDVQSPQSSGGSASAWALAWACSTGTVPSRLINR